MTEIVEAWPSGITKDELFQKRYRAKPRRNYVIKVCRSSCPLTLKERTSRISLITSARARVPHQLRPELTERVG